MSDVGIVAPPDWCGGLTIGGVDLMRPGDGTFVAWSALDLGPFDDGPELRGGESTLYPGVAGRRANPRRLDETTYRLSAFICTGALDPDGDPNTNPYQGLKDNKAYLFDNVVAVGSTTKPAVYTAPNGSTAEADVQAQFVWGERDGDYDQPAVLFVKVPSGIFTPVEP
jgi:hypothetical protein